MQLCEFCTQNTTQPDGTICRRDKREKGVLFAPCDDFTRRGDISQATYEQVKDLLRHVRSQAEAEKRDDRPVYKIDVSMAFTEKDFLGGVVDIPRDLHLDLLETDLNDREQVEKFLNREEVLRFIPKRWEIEDLMAVQADLKEMMERWADSPADFGVEGIPLNLGDRQDVVATVYRGARLGLGRFVEDGDKVNDVFRLTCWIRGCFEFSIERTAEGVIKPYALVALGRLWYGILYFLFAQDVIEGQEYKQCPVCKIFFRPDIKKGPLGATCGKPKCRTYFSTHKEELIRNG